MRAARRTAITMAAAAFAACSDPPTGPTPEPEPDDPVVAELVDLVNDHRASIGCPRLAWHLRTAAVALAHSRDMVERDYFGHENPEGVGLVEGRWTHLFVEDAR